MKRWKKGLFISLFSSLLWEQQAVEAAVGLSYPRDTKHINAYPPAPVLVTAARTAPKVAPAAAEWARFIPDPVLDAGADPEESVQTHREAVAVREEIAAEQRAQERQIAERKQKAAAKTLIASRGDLPARGAQGTLQERSAEPQPPVPAEQNAAQEMQTAARQSSQQVSNSAPKLMQNSGVSATRSSSAVTVALKYQGTPYRYGGTTPSGFDCSGFIQYVMNQIGVSVPRTTYQQIGAGVAVSKSNLQPGDVVFFSPGGSPASHAGLYMGNGQFIHADQTRGIVVSDLFEGYWAGVYQAAVRVA